MPEPRRRADWPAVSGTLGQCCSLEPMATPLPLRLVLGLGEGLISHPGWLGGGYLSFSEALRSLDNASAAPSHRDWLWTCSWQSLPWVTGRPPD